MMNISSEDRLLGLYSIGATGTGKSTYLIQLIRENIKNGEGVCVIDPHGRMINSLMAHLDNYDLSRTILLDLTDQQYVFGLNLFACPENEYIDEWIGQVLRVFSKIWGVGGVKVSGWGATLEDLLRNIANTLIDNPGMTLTEVPLLLRNADVRKKMIEQVTNPDVFYYWENDYNQFNMRRQLEDTDSTLNKVRSFLTYRQVRAIVGQSVTTVNMRKLMDEDKIILVKLDPRNDDTTTLIGTMLMSEIVSATYNRQSATPFFLYADEFQKFATSDFARLFAEARKFGVAVTVSHQFRDQLDLENRSATLNAGNFVVFRVSGKDAEELAPEFSHLPEPERLDRIEEEVTDMIEEEIKAPAPDPLGYLRHHAHGNPLLDGYIQKYILPLFNTFVFGDKSSYVFSLQGDRSGYFNYSMEYRYWQQAESILNQLMLDAMVGTLDFSYPTTSHTSAFVRLTEFFILLRAYFRFDDGGYFVEIYREEYIRCMEVFFTPGADTTPLEPFLLKQLNNKFFSANFEKREYPKSVAEASNGPYMPIVQEARHWIHEAQCTCQALIHLLKSLKTEPFLVSTGQKRLVPKKHTVVHYIQHPQRPYADTKNQTAEELAKQPNFTARYRSLDGEGVLEVSPPEKGQFDAAERIETVKKRLIEEKVLRSRKEVEEEIMRRYTTLLPSLKKTDKEKSQVAVQDLHIKPPLRGGKPFEG